jgi:F-type H+-transporting ATPase subunit b
MNPLIFLAQAPNPADTVREIGERFGFHWTLFLSNCFSFLIVCVLLQKFAYKPVVDMLELRRTKIAEGLKNAEEIKTKLAEAEATKAEILTKANAEAQRMIEDARASAAAVAEKKTQQAVSEAEQIIAKAREATQIEHDRMLTDLKREVGRLVISTTTKVTGRILTEDDQRRINEETAGQVAA